MNKLDTILRNYGQLAVAFSGGNDSLVLAFYAQKVLGEENILLLHANSCFVTSQEQAVLSKIRLNFISLNVDILSHQLIVKNDAMRCYHCKKLLFSCLGQEALKHGFKHFADGSHLGDLSEDRKGFLAAKELGVLHPFIESGMNKDSIGKMAQELGVSALLHESRACLATRFKTHMPIMLPQLREIAQVEDRLIEQGFTSVRCRVTPCGYLLQVASHEISRLEKITTLPIDPLGYQKSE